MKQKENIFEELNKMKNLIHTRPGVVISEQIILSERDAVAGTDDDLISISQLLNSPIDTTQKQINSIAPSFSNRKSVIFKSPNNTTYVFFRFKPGGYFNPQNFVLKISGQQKTFGTFDLQNIYFKDPSTPESQWGQDSGFNTIVPIASIKGSGTPAASGAENAEDVWKNPNVSCVPSQPGAKVAKMSNGSTAYLVGQIYYYSNGRKKLADGTMGNYNCSTEFKSRGSSNPGGRANTSSLSVNDRFTKTAQSLGIQNAKMDVATLQTMLKSLQGDMTASSPTQGAPDIEQLKTALNQLKQ